MAELQWEMPRSRMRMLCTFLPLPLPRESAFCIATSPRPRRTLYRVPASRNVLVGTFSKGKPRRPRHGQGPGLSGAGCDGDTYALRFGWDVGEGM